MDRIFKRALVPSDFKGSRLDKAAATLFSDFSRSQLKTWIKSGTLTLGGMKVEPKTRLSGGEELVLDAQLDSVIPVESEDIPLTVVHQDKSILVIDKPPGLVVHPGAGNPSGTLQNALLNLDESLSILPRAGIVHRLDKDTSGLLLIARTMGVRNRLVAELERREIQRQYEGVCQGVATGGGKVEAPISRHPKDRLKMAVLTGGRPALTHYRVMEKFRAHTHLSLTLNTGRTHQIRVHLAHIRMPLVGDPVYGGRPRFPPKPGDEIRLLLQEFSRQALHATRLAFHHPEDGKLVSYRSPLPDDIRMLLEILRKDANAGD